jgi:hypothetical protein
MAVSRGQKAPIRFIFLWLAEQRWEGRDYLVGVQQEAQDNDTDTPHPRKAHTKHSGAIALRGLRSSIRVAAGYEHSNPRPGMEEKRTPS